MSRPRVTAVIVTYESRETIDDAMREARRANEEGLLDCVVVDNDSHDGTPEFLEAQHSWARLVRSPENVGFARACKVGFGHVHTSYVLLLNPDAVLPVEALRTLIGFLDEHPQAGIVGPAIREPDEKLQLAGGLPTPRRIVLAAAGCSRAYPDRVPVVPDEPPFRTDWLCGAILLIRKRLLDELDGFDSRFFLYFEETDFCLRALRRDWEIWAVGQAVAEHRNAVSAASAQATLYEGCIAQHYFESRFYYLAKHHGQLAAICSEILAALFETIRSLLRWATGRDRGDAAVRARLPILRQPRRNPEFG
jgi:GT2 family glycosyltransferase